MEDAKDYYSNTVGKKRCFIVVVGNAKEADLKSKIETALGVVDLEKNNYRGYD